MNILFIAKFYPDNLIPEFVSKTKIGLDHAANNLHRALFQGFKENCQKISILNAPILGSFPPYYKSPFVSGYSSEEDDIISLSFCNISYIKRWDINRKMEKEALRWCKRTEGKKVLFFYNFTALPILFKVKKKYPDVKACLLVTDLPEYMTTDNSLLTRINKKVSSLFFKENENVYNLVDGYILLAPDMRERLLVGKKPWLHMEGIYNPEADEVKISKSREKIILYTGNICERYGILNLLNAFEKIKSPNYRLWIRGNGDTLDEIKRRMSQDSRIVYFDKMSKNELMKLQKQATLLVNPVLTSQEFTRFFFPSKTLEYLASGTPALMAPLKCIPKEYEQHLYYFKDESIEGIANRIVEICEKPMEELEEFGRMASNFIHEFKTPQPQVNKIISFLQHL